MQAMPRNRSQRVPSDFSILTGSTNYAGCAERCSPRRREQLSVASTDRSVMQAELIAKWSQHLPTFQYPQWIDQQCRSLMDRAPAF